MQDKIEIEEGLELISPYPAAYLRCSKALVVSDTHFGIEAELARKGIYVPDSLFKDTLDSILIPARETGCKFVYVLGDLKHRYGRPTESEWWEIRRFVSEIRAIGAELVVVLGNHDRYISGLLRTLGVSYFVDHAILDGFLLTHGHKIIHLEKKEKAGCILIGHEHPAISFKNEFSSRKERFKSFLLVPGNKTKEPKLLVLPSVNPLTFGTDVNTTKGDEFISPYMRERAGMMRRARPFVLEVGKILLPFPELSKIVAS